MHSLPLHGPISSCQPRYLVICDRDGTIIEDHGQSATTDDIVLVEHTVEFLRSLPADVAIYVATNQRAVSMGVFTPDELDTFHLAMSQRLLDEGVSLTHVLACLHATEPSGAPLCTCRKPLPGMITEALRASGVPPAHALVIGDKLTDVEAAHSAGVLGLQLTSPTGIESAYQWIAARQ